MIDWQLLDPNKKKDECELWLTEELKKGWEIGLEEFVTRWMFDNFMTELAVGIISCFAPFVSGRCVDWNENCEHFIELQVRVFIIYIIYKFEESYQLIVHFITLHSCVI
jgi:hypothetical protein